MPAVPITRKLSLLAVFLAGSSSRIWQKLASPQRDKLLLAHPRPERVPAFQQGVAEGEIAYESKDVVELLRIPRLLLRLE